MKAVMKIILIGAALTLAGANLNAQDKKKSKQKESDVAYLQHKRQMDEQRNRDAEMQRYNDSVQTARRHDSIAEQHRSDSIRWSKMGKPDSINAPELYRDSLYRDVRPRMDKGTPPNEEQAPKGPNPSVRRIDFGAMMEPIE